MIPIASQLDRFLDAVHRRMILLRILERIGLCILIGSALCLILMPILIWRSQPAMPLALGCLGLGAGAGMIWGISRRPTRLAAAIEADCQLKASDLLATALFLQRLPQPLDPMARAVLAAAHARAAAVRPSAIILNRIGARGWGGIGLCAALALAIALVTAGERPARASDSATAMRSWRDAATSPDQAPSPAANPTDPDFRRSRPGQGADDDPRPTQLPGDPPPDPRAGASPNPNLASANPNATDSSTGPGAGAGRSSSTPDPNSQINPAAAAAHPQPGTPVTSSANTSSGGPAAAQQGNTRAAAGQQASSNPNHNPAPVWAARDWPNDRTAALEAIRAGQVPDDYRELVKDYFQRQ